MSNDLILDIYFPKFADYLMRGETSPAFSKLAAIGAWQVDEAHSIYASLCQRFGLEKQQDWPLATLAQLGENLALSAKQSFLVHPAHFVLQRDHFTLGETLALSQTESSALISTLNAHFAQDGIRFNCLPNHEFWTLQIDTPLAVETSLLAQALGRDVRAFMPRGQDGMQLQSMMNQVQMLFHEHPVNQAREQASEVAVNSVWIDGASDGQGLNLNATSPKSIFTNGAIGRGLAIATNFPCQALPESLLDVLFEGDTLMVVGSNEQLMHQVFEELTQLLKQSTFNTIQCCFDVHGYTFTLTLRPKDRWKFWRKSQPISAYFNTNKSA